MQTPLQKHGELSNLHKYLIKTSLLIKIYKKEALEFASETSKIKFLNQELN